jgi:hypothetical protein
MKIKTINYSLLRNRVEDKAAPMQFIKAQPASLSGTSKFSVTQAACTALAEI